MYFLFDLNHTLNPKTMHKILDYFASSCLNLLPLVACLCIDILLFFIITMFNAQSCVHLKFWKIFIPSMSSWVASYGNEWYHAKNLLTKMSWFKFGGIKQWWYAFIGNHYFEQLMLRMYTDDTFILIATTFDYLFFIMFQKM